MLRRDYKNPHELPDPDAALEALLQQGSPLLKRLVLHLEHGGRLPQRWTGRFSAAGYAASRLRLAASDAEHIQCHGCAATHRKAAEALVGKKD